MTTNLHAAISKNELPFINDYKFTPEELIVLTSFIKVVPIRKKEKILIANEKEQYLRIVNKGIVREYCMREGNQINVHFAQKNDVVCAYTSYCTGQPSQFYIEAVENSILFCFSKSDIEYLISKGGKFAPYIHALIGHMCMQKDDRQIYFLNRTAQSALQLFVEKHTDLFMKLPQIYIASYLNIQPETLSSLKRKLSYSTLA